MLVDVWKKFQGLLPSQTTIIATVDRVNTDGTSTLTTPEGGTLVAQGTVVPEGDNAYVQNGRVVGPAPELQVFDLTV